MGMAAMATCCVCFDPAGGDRVCCRPGEDGGHILCGACAVKYVSTCCSGPAQDYERQVAGRAGVAAVAAALQTTTVIALVVTAT